MMRAKQPWGARGSLCPPSAWSWWNLGSEGDDPDSWSDFDSVDYSLISNWWSDKIDPDILFPNSNSLWMDTNRWYHKTGRPWPALDSVLFSLPSLKMLIIVWFLIIFFTGSHLGLRCVLYSINYWSQTFRLRPADWWAWVGYSWFSGRGQSICSDSHQPPVWCLWMYWATPCAHLWLLLVSLRWGPSATDSHRWRPRKELAGNWFHVLYNRKTHLLFQLSSWFSQSRVVRSWDSPPFSFRERTGWIICPSSISF